jgi:hypothetical protein
VYKISPPARTCAGGNPREPGQRRRPRPARDILCVIALKLAMLTLLAQLFFPASGRPRVDAGAVAQHLFTNPDGASR